jgi:1-acyl-sn-glycerol-3-phosphate acyltransferase
MNRKNLQDIVRYLIKTITFTEWIGTENVPRQGGFILATNHMSRADVPILFGMPVRDDVIALAGDSYKKNPLFKYFVETTHSIWIDRNSADFSALRASVACLKNGNVLGIAPEGTRSRTAQLIEGKAGIALIAERTHAPIVPVALAGSESTFTKLFTLRRPRITIRFGKAFELPPMQRSDRDAWLKTSIDEIMCRIAALLPPQYHGFYANHPRLKELLAS